MQSKSITLTTNAALALNAALIQLDGYRKLNKESGAFETVYYSLGGPTRFAIARNLTALEPIVEAFDKTRKAMVRRFASGGSTVPADKAADFTAELDEAAAVPVTVEVWPIATNKLKVGDGGGDNPIPGTVLSALLPLFVDADGE